MTTISTSPPSSASSAGKVAARLSAVRGRIVEAGGDLDRIRIVAVTKGFGSWAVQAALDAGLRDIGENYAAELVSKAAAVAASESQTGRGEGSVSPVWHYLGAIQRNKVAALAPVVGLWQSVARSAEAERIARFAPGARVLAEAELTGLPGRNGCPVADVPALVERMRELGLDVRGLMTVAAPSGQGAMAAGEVFDRVGELADSLGLPERSMGMTDDLEAAVAAGTTMVRIGRALFGERPPRAS